MEYLEGPLVGNFDFMFEDEEGNAAAGAQVTLEATQGQISSQSPADATSRR
jgi:hypothetical protein